MPDAIAAVARFPHLFARPTAPAQPADLRVWLDRLSARRWGAAAPAQMPVRFQEVVPGLLRGGRIETKEQLRALRDVYGVTTILNLAGDTVQPEAGWANELGMKVVYSFMDAKQTPGPGQWATIKATLLQGRVYVHCREGKDRTGAVVARYREEVQGWNAKLAYDEAVRIGFYPGFDALKRFIGV
jgi:hypothetical protein